VSSSPNSHSKPVRTSSPRSERGEDQDEGHFQLHPYGAAASATGAHAGESPAGRIGRFTTDSPMPVPPRGWEGKAGGELNRQAVTKMNHIQ
jgi:hypothetical protein